MIRGDAVTERDRGCLTLMREFVILAALLAGSIPSFGQHPPTPAKFLRSQIHLSAGEMSDIRKGEAVAKILDSSSASDIFVFGAVYIHAEPVAYLHLMRDINGLNLLSGYLAAGEFGKTPTIRDMDRLALDQDDITDLRNCRPEHCELQLPEEFMEVPRSKIQWNSPNVVEEVNELAKHRILQLVGAYQRDGNRALGTYRDKRTPCPWLSISGPCSAGLNSSLSTCRS